MTNPGNGQPVRYEVRTSEHVKARVRELHREFAQEGSGQRFLSSLRTILGRLREDPNGFGEPLYRLPALNLIVCQGVYSGVAVRFGVHQMQPLVLVSDVRVLGRP